MVSAARAGRSRDSRQDAGATFYRRNFLRALGFYRGTFCWDPVWGGVHLWVETFLR
jgi:hypothetical protein